MRPAHRRSRGAKRVYAPAVGLTALTAVVVTSVTIADVALAERLASEDGPIEWLQVVLFAGAALITARLATREWGDRRSGAPDVLLTAGFAFLAICEMELPRRVLGKSIKMGRLTRDVAAGLPRETIFVLVVAGLAVSLGVYALRHRADLVTWARAALETAWGRLFVLGVSILVLTEICERSLNRMMGSGLPRSLLEESLELLAALYCALAMLQRREPGAPTARRPY